MKSKVVLERAIRAVRDDAPSDAEIASARARFEQRWHEPSAVPTPTPDAPLRSCEDIQALFPQYGRNTLAGARTLLVRNHLAECSKCRMAYRRRGTLKIVGEVAMPNASPIPRPRKRGVWQLAAAALLFAVAFVALRSAWFDAGRGVVATVQAISGVLYRVDGARADRLAAGATLVNGELIRADAAPQTLLRLADGSTVELGERAELAVETRSDATTLRLNRGQVIVQAAKRDSGHLYVATRDCRVAVTGTVFSVTSSVKGSRVSVVHGEVHVSRTGGTENVLHRGDQVTTSAALGHVPLEQELAWSRNLEQHLALLHEMSSLQKDWNRLPAPELRYSSHLIDLVPEDAVFYASLPNYGETLAEGYRLLKTRFGESSVLKRWWQLNEQGTEQAGQGEHLDAFIENLHQLSTYLGDEVVFTTALGATGDRLLALAEVKNSGLAERLRERAATLLDGTLPLTIVTENDVLHGTLPDGDGLVALVTPSVAAISASREAIHLLVARLDAGGTTAFATTPLGDQVAQAYARGAGLFVAADLELLSAYYGSCVGSCSTALASLGAKSTEPRFLVYERKPVAGQVLNSGALTFAGARAGVASWLAAPAPMGSLEFVTAQASAVAAFLVKQPTAVLDDVLQALPNGDASLKLNQLERVLDIRLREDLTDALGAEIALALDGPLLPQPAWKLIVEVQDRERLERAFETLLRRANQKLRETGAGVVTVEHESVDGTTYHRIRTKDTQLPIDASYAFVDGYLVVAPSRALVRRAIDARSSGDSLARSARFTALLPRDDHASLSGLVFQDFLGILAATLGTADLEPNPQQRRRLQQILDQSAPSLFALYGEIDRIEMTGVGNLFPVGPEMLAMPSLLRHTFPTLTEPR
jgi:ferric-dicitrate binding protein FerR (iron transport regulator)